MPIYTLKRYHKVVPTNGAVWHLGREIAFEAVGDAEATAFAQAQRSDDLGGGGLVIVLDPKGNRVWENAI